MDITKDNFNKNTFFKKIGIYNKPIAEIKENTLIFYQEYLTVSDIPKIIKFTKQNRNNLEKFQLI